jgi:hypothetical protein
MLRHETADRNVKIGPGMVFFLIMVFSLFLSLLLMFVVPGTNSYAAGFAIFILGFLFFSALIALIVSKIMQWSRRRTD